MNDKLININESLLIKIKINRRIKAIFFNNDN
jgi:hypothetical protein